MFYLFVSIYRHKCLDNTLFACNYNKLFVFVVFCSLLDLMQIGTL
jgi:hypothetical protein